MKALAMIGMTLAIIGLIIAGYCQIEIVPNYNALDARYDLSDIERMMWHDYNDQKFLLGSIGMLLGAISAIAGIISGLKKQKLGWIALAIGLVAFFLGTAQSTHMFS